MSEIKNQIGIFCGMLLQCSYLSSNANKGLDAEQTSWDNQPFTSWHDLYLISPRGITTKSKIKVTRLQEMITN